VRLRGEQPLPTTIAMQRAVAARRTRSVLGARARAGREFGGVSISPCIISRSPLPRGLTRRPSDRRTRATPTATVVTERFERGGGRKSRAPPPLSEVPRDAPPPLTIATFPHRRRGAPMRTAPTALPFPRCLHLQDQLRERRRRLVRVAERACRARSGASGSRGVPTLRNRRAGPDAGVADARAPARGVVAARVRRPSSHPTHFWFTPATRCQRGVTFAQRA
jgi:hypothetical protein